MKIEVLIEIEKLKHGQSFTPFIMDPEHLVDWKKVEIDWECAPDRILRMFDQPIRKATGK